MGRADEGNRPPAMLPLELNHGPKSFDPACIITKAFK